MRILPRIWMLAVALTWIGFAAGCKNSEPQPPRFEVPQPKMSVESANSPFNNYDHEVVRGIQARWYELVGASRRKLKAGAKGTVVVQFQLMSDGRVKNVQVVNSDVDKLHTLLCQKAVLDPAPFPSWPDGMAKIANAPFREIRFTFYYE